MIISCWALTFDHVLELWTKLAATHKELPNDQMQIILKILYWHSKNNFLLKKKNQRISALQRLILDKLKFLYSLLMKSVSAIEMCESFEASTQSRRIQLLITAFHTFPLVLQQSNHVCERNRLRNPRRDDAARMNSVFRLAHWPRGLFVFVNLNAGEEYSFSLQSVCTHNVKLVQHLTCATLQNYILQIVPT